MFNIIKSFKLKSECQKLNASHILLKSVTVWFVDDKDRRTDTITFHLMVNGYGNRKVKVDTSCQPKKHAFDHRVYISSISPWLLGSLDMVGVQGEMEYLNYYYENYVFNGKIYKRKVMVCSEDEEAMDTIFITKKGA